MNKLYELGKKKILNGKIDFEKILSKDLPPTCSMCPIDEIECGGGRGYERCCKAIASILSCACPYYNECSPMWKWDDEHKSFTCTECANKE